MPTGAPGPTVTPGGGSSGLDDEFNTGGPSPDPRWTFVGAGTSKVDVNHEHPGELRFDLDPATSQACWVSSSNCSRLLESAPPGDFRIDVKLDTLPPLGATDEHSIGLLVYQDQRNFIRFELQKPASETARSVVAHVVNDGVGHPSVTSCPNLVGIVAPFYLRVTHAGNSWLLAYSADGTTYHTCGTFVQEITIRGIGPQVENEGHIGNFTFADFDYFRVTRGILAVAPAAMSTVPPSSAIAAQTPRPAALATRTSIVAVPRMATEVPTVTPRPTHAAPATPSPTATTLANPAEAGVPMVDPNHLQDVRAWWAQQPLNPRGPGG